MIYICIPTHNEQQTVGVVLWKLRQVLTDFPRDYQLLVADDASTDKTPEVLEPYTRVLPLTVIRSDRRQGYAASLEMLLREAVRRSEYPKRDAVVALQADFSDEPDDLVGLVKRLEAGADVAVGNKVSTARDTRSRRFSRALAGFFARGLKWPEGVLTPFDGFRAYRLYAVKKAMEDRPGRRLVRYDGWAGHAELLRAVLPHARRVDVVDVDDRPDRLQRPRREKPFAAALQVRAMTAGTEPPGLIGVEELDRIAATTSRSRERAALVVQPTQNGPSRTNGSRSRTGRSEGRPQTRGRQGAERRPRAEKTERGGERQPRKSAPEAGRGDTANRRPQRPESERPRRERRPAEARKRPPAQEKATAEAEANVAPPTDESLLPADTGAALTDSGGPVEEGDAPKPKRRRRRRRKSGAKAGQEPGSPESTEREAAEESSAEADAGTSSNGDTQKKRRRRGGRRGGRGRRKPQAGGSPEAGAADAELTARAGDAEPQGAAPAPTE